MALAKIAELEAESARTQKNKNTEFHLGLLKAKLARLKSEVVLGAKGPGGRPGDGFDVHVPRTAPPNGPLSRTPTH